MARARAAKHPANAEIEPEETSQEVPDEEPAVVIEPTPAPASNGTMTKADACRAALAAGIDTTEKAVKFARTKFGVEIKPTDFSLYKSKAKGKEEAPAPRGRKPKAPLVEGYVAPPEKPRAAGEPDMLLALEGIKELVGQFGADRVKRMVDIIG